MFGRNRIGNIVGLIDEDQLCAGQTDGAVKRAAAANHDHFVFQPGGIGQLPNFLRIAPGHTGCRRSGHGPRGARSDDSGFRTGQFGQSTPDSVMQFDHIHKITSSVCLSLEGFSKLQRSAEVRPRSAAIDDGFHTEPAVNIAARVQTDRGSGLYIKSLRGDLSQQRRGRQHFHESATVRFFCKRHGFSLGMKFLFRKN